jgi:hypothetical protein
MFMMLAQRAMLITAAFMPGLSPPLVNTAILCIPFLHAGAPYRIARRPA